MEHLDSIVSLVVIPFVNQSFGGTPPKMLPIPEARGAVPRLSLSELSKDSVSIS